MRREDRHADRLKAGTYDVVIQDAAKGARQSQLVVATDAGAVTSCDLPPEGTTIRVEDPGYSTSCSVDSDCMLATVGSACGFRCPNAAIAKTEQARYEAEARAKTSQCIPNAPAPVPSCPAFRAVC